MTNQTTFFRIMAMILSILTLLAAVAIPTTAAEVSTVYIEDTFEQYGVTSGNVTDKSISADYAGSTNYAIVGEGALAGNRSILVSDHVDFRWWARSITAEKLTMEYKIHVPVGSTVTFTACMTLDGDSSTSNEGLGGAVTVIKGNGSDLGVYDRSDNLITALEYGKTYSMQMNFTARSDKFTLVINGESYTDIPLSSPVYTVTAFRLNAAGGSSFYFDDFKVYSVSRTYPQKYSAQETGKMVELDYPTYYKAEGITLWLNRDGTEAGKSALKLDMPVKEANNTLYLPFETVKEQFPINSEVESDPMLITWDGTEYITIQDTATLCGGTVWWDEAEEMVVFTVGERKTDGILRNINGRFYMNGQPYYEISFNKFDIAAQILINYFPDNFRDFNIGEDQRANAERALKELSDNGFTSIRFFSYVETYAMIHDPAESEKYWAGLDELYDLCDKYGIKVVPSLSLGSSVMTACEYVEGLGYVSVGEDRIDLITNPESKSREFQKQYIETYVNRYKDRDTVLMWEINNEMNLDMDIGPSIGKVTYSAYQLSEFYAWCTAIINECDPARLVTSGDSVQRNSNYHLLAGTMAGHDGNDWTTDTYAQRLYMNYLIHGLGGLDVTSVHAYGENTDNLHITESRLRATASRMSMSIMADEARALGQPLYVGEAGTGTANGNTDMANIQKTLDGYVSLGLQLVHWWSYDTCRQDSFGDDESWNMNMTEFAESVALIKAANEALKAKWLVNRADADVIVTDTGDNNESETTTPNTAPDTAPDTEKPTEPSPEDPAENTDKPTDPSDGDTQEQTDKPADPSAEDTTESIAAPDETSPAEKKGCGATLAGLGMILSLLGGCMLIRRRRES